MIVLTWRFDLFWFLEFNFKRFNGIGLAFLSRDWISLLMDASASLFYFLGFIKSVTEKVRHEKLPLKRILTSNGLRHNPLLPHRNE